jgi:hypothetical protein
MKAKHGGIYEDGVVGLLRRKVDGAFPKLPPGGPSLWAKSWDHGAGLVLFARNEGQAIACLRQLKSHIARLGGFL